MSLSLREQLLKAVWPAQGVRIFQESDDRCWRQFARPMDVAMVASHQYSQLTAVHRHL